MYPFIIFIIYLFLKNYWQNSLSQAPNYKLAMEKNVHIPKQLHSSTKNSLQ